jgi:hypothetical protein
MKLPAVVAAPSIVAAPAGELLLVSRLTLGDFAFLLQGCSDALGLDADGGNLIKFGAEEMTAWMFGDGIPAVLYSVLRKHWPTRMTLAESAAVATSLDVQGYGQVFAKATRRDLSAIPTEGEGRDISRVMWAANAFTLFERIGLSLVDFADLTLDQYHILASQGDCGEIDADDMEQGSQGFADRMAEMQEQWEAIHGKPGPGVSSGSGGVTTTIDTSNDPPSEITLADYGLRIAPETEQESEVSDG